MKPRVRWFTWVDGHHTEHGLAGWQMKGFEDLEPAADFGVAHDALEHHTLALGMDAEMQAFGAILYGRWQRDGLGLCRPLAADVHDFLGTGAKWCTPCKRFTTLDDDDWSETAIAEFAKELKGMLVDSGNYDDSDMLDDRIKDMCEWIRRGFRRTARVWENHYGHHAFLSAFDDIVREVKRIGSAEPGDRLKIRIDACGGVQIKHLDAYGRNRADY